MKAILFALLTHLAALSTALAIDAAKGFETDSIVLYQPDSVLEARVPVADLVSYFKQLQAVCTEFFATTTKPENLHLVVVLRPDNRSKVWFISSTLPPTDLSREPLRKKLEAVRPCDIRGGPVAFAIAAKLAGGDGNIPKGGDKDFSPPIPKAWSDAKPATNGVPLHDSYFDSIWPDTSTK